MWFWNLEFSNKFLQIPKLIISQIQKHTKRSKNNMRCQQWPKLKVFDTVDSFAAGMTVDPSSKLLRSSVMAVTEFRKRSVDAKLLQLERMLTTEFGGERVTEKRQPLIKYKQIQISCTMIISSVNWTDNGNVSNYVKLWKILRNPEIY